MAHEAKLPSSSKVTFMLFPLVVHCLDIVFNLYLYLLV